MVQALVARIRVLGDCAVCSLGRGTANPQPQVRLVATVEWELDLTMPSKSACRFANRVARPPRRAPDSAAKTDTRLAVVTNYEPTPVSKLSWSRVKEKRETQHAQRYNTNKQAKNTKTKTESPDASTILLL